MADAAAAQQAHTAFDTDGDGQADFFCFAGTDGTVNRLGYDVTGDGDVDRLAVLSAVPPARSRHVLLILDGVTYDLVAELHAAGRLRVFHPPSRVIAPYPSMTDLCLSQALKSTRPLAYEAKYFDHQANRLVGGAGAYLAEANEPHLALLQYTDSTLYRALGFLWPGYLFGRELRNARGVFERAETLEMLAYFGTTAGMGTRKGRDGHRAVVERMEQLAHYLLWRTHGTVEITLMSDHGHSYTAAVPWPAAAHLTEKGWRLGTSLSGPRDAVQIGLGLLTFASFATKSPADLAADLVDCEGVDIISYAEDDRVVVLDGQGQRAAIRERNGRFAYEPIDGDPLRLGPVLQTLSADEDGTYNADALLAATVEHVYPAPLQRLWRGHFAVVEHPADVLVSLQDNYFAGSSGLAGSVVVASTHGSLNRPNTTTFIMSTIAPLPPVLRSQDIPHAMATLFGEPWPLRR